MKIDVDSVKIAKLIYLLNENREGAHCQECYLLGDCENEPCNYRYSTNLYKLRKELNKGG